jgi:hypothetical protein
MIKYIKSITEGRICGYKAPKTGNIPHSEGNRDFQRMMALVEAGDAEIVEVDITPVLTYADHRQIEYGPITDQLDMQYHDSINGTTTWVDHVEAVKTKYPKG